MNMKHLGFLLFTLPFQLNAEELPLDLSAYPKAAEISFGEMTTEVLPEQYIKLSAPFSGRLDIKIGSGFHEKDTVWAEFEPDQIALEREALELTKQLYQLKEKPGARLEMADAKAALESRRDELKRNVTMVDEVLSEPDLAELFLDQEGGNSAESRSTVRQMRERLLTQLSALNEALVFVGTPEQERIELRVLEIQLEKKEAELERKERESKLKLPFSGDFKYLMKLPEDPEAPLNMQSGNDIAELKNYGRLECHMVVSRPELRQLPTPALSLRFSGEGSVTPLEARFLRKDTREIFGKPELVYVFNFPQDQAGRGRVLVGGRISADLILNLNAEAVLIPKLDLVRAAPEEVRNLGWRQGVAQILPGYRAVSVGQSDVAVVKIPESE